jgi:hypothetical protein
MKASEKALQILSKFGDIEDLGIIGNYNGTWEWSSTQWMRQTKQASLISVNEKLKTLEEIKNLNLSQTILDLIEYWQQVKQEILKQ